MEHTDVKYRRKVQTESATGKRMAAIKVDQALAGGCLRHCRREEVRGYKDRGEARRGGA